MKTKGMDCLSSPHRPFVRIISLEQERNGPQDCQGFRPQETNLEIAWWGTEKWLREGTAKDKSQIVSSVFICILARPFYTSTLGLHFEYACIASGIDMF